MFTEWGLFDAVTLIQSNYAGHFEVVARRGSELFALVRDENGWQGPWPIGGGAGGNPVLIQSRFGTQGNFELAVPNEQAGVDYYYRDNDKGAVWIGPIPLFRDHGHVDGVGFMQSNYGEPDNLELVMRRGQSLAFGFRRDLDPWEGPFGISEPTDPFFRIAGEPLLKRGYTDYLGSFSNNPLQHQAATGLIGTDLGAGFETVDGRLGFLFGDSWTDDGLMWDHDSVASTSATKAERYDIPPIKWATDLWGRFAPMDVPFVPTLGMETPLDAIALFGQHYVFFNAAFHTFCEAADCPGAHGALALATMQGLDPTTLSERFELPTSRFNIVNIVPFGGYLYLFGASTPYRHGSVYLARFLPEEIENPDRWRYYRGVRGGSPVFGPGEGTAVPLFAAGQSWSSDFSPLTPQHTGHGVGELSVRMYSGVFLMTYNTDVSPIAPRGIQMRTAVTPWGPWSRPELLLTETDAYGRWQHKSLEKTHVDDGLSEPGRENTWGGEYSPNLIPRWFVDEGKNEHRIVFTLSSWNPYQVHLLETVMTTDGHHVDPPGRGAGLPVARVANGDFSTWDTSGWTQVGGPFAVVPGPDGKPRLTTFGAQGDATVGELYQEVLIDETTTRLKFRVHGGWGRVVLVRNHNDETVRSVHAWENNDVETEVEWDVRDFRGEYVRIAIEDDLTGDWGFVGATGFEFE